MSWREDRDKADRLFSLIIRHRDVCERCRHTDIPLDTAHIIGRSHNTVRTDLINAWCLCRSCHQLVDSDRVAKDRLVLLTIGQAAFDRLYTKAQQRLPTTPTLFWRNEIERLTAVCAIVGITTED
jgi:hypothetical protein